MSPSPSEQGQSHALVGRNGAGKSTLVAIMTGMAAPDEGAIRFSGQAAPSLSDRNGWRRNVACVYQRTTIIPALTVAENLFINRQSTGSMDRLEGAQPPRFRRCSRSTACDVERLAGRRRPRRREPAAGRDRPRPVDGRAVHHPRRADRPARRRRRGAPLPPHARAAGHRRHVSLHLPPPPRNLRGLRDRDRAARRAAHRHAARRASCRASSWSRR